MSEQEKQRWREHASNLVNQAIMTLEKIEDSDPGGPEEFGRALLEAAMTEIDSQTHADLCENCMTALFGV